MFVDWQWEEKHPEETLMFTGRTNSSQNVPLMILFEVPLNQGPSHWRPSCSEWTCFFSFGSVDSFEKLQLIEYLTKLVIRIRLRNDNVCRYVIIWKIQQLKIRKESLQSVSGSFMYLSLTVNRIDEMNPFLLNSVLIHRAVPVRSLHCHGGVHLPPQSELNISHESVCLSRMESASKQRRPILICSAC